MLKSNLVSSVPYFELVKNIMHFFDVYRTHSEKEIELRDARIEHLEKELAKSEEVRKKIIQERDQTIQENKQVYEKIVKNLQNNVITNSFSI